MPDIATNYLQLAKDFYMCVLMTKVFRRVTSFKLNNIIIEVVVVQKVHLESSTLLDRDSI